MSSVSQEKKVKAVAAKNIRSTIYYKKNERLLRNAIEDVSFTAELKKAYWVASSSVFEGRLFLEILANSKPYESGECVLMERGMYKKKHVILDHVFYIASTNNLYKNMTVIEYLMFITSREKVDARKRQGAIFELLKRHGLSGISLTLIDLLSAQERLLVLLFVASMVKSSIIIINLPRLTLSNEQIKSFKSLSLRIKNQNKSIVFTSTDPILANEVADGILYIDEGKRIFEGSREEFVSCYDKCLYSMYDDDIDLIASKLEASFPTLEIRSVREEDCVQIWDPKDIIKNTDDFYLALFRAGISSRIVERNIQNVKNALWGMRNYDL